MVVLIALMETGGPTHPEQRYSLGLGSGLFKCRGELSTNKHTCTQSLLLTEDVTSFLQVPALTSLQ